MRAFFMSLPLRSIIVVSIAGDKFHGGIKLFQVLVLSEVIRGSGPRRCTSLVTRNRFELEVDIGGICYLLSLLLGDMHF